jgi:hypothetical protein
MRSTHKYVSNTNKNIPMKIPPTEKRTDGILLTRLTVNDYENRRGKVKNLNL